MVLPEKNFPRGGISNTETKSDDLAPNIIFGATQKKIKKAPKPKDNNLLVENKNEYSEQLQAVSAETLTFDTLQEDMLVMGVVKATNATSLEIAIPGRMTARALVADISDAYTTVAKSAINGDVSEYSDLSELFSIGQIVYGRAIKTQKLNAKQVTLLLNLKPKDVHANLLHMNVKKGFIFSGAIAEIQEHGYVIETGIQGLHTFVAQEKAQTRHIGELAFLRVKQIQHSATQSTCTCVEVDQAMLKIKSKTESNLDYILPGSIVKFKVSKQFKNGLQGTIINETFTAYVNEHHLAEALHTPQDYELNEEYNARVLYVMPLTKLVYLTLNLDIKTIPNEIANDDDEEEAENSEEVSLKKGSIVEKAKVLRLGTGGVVFLLNKKYKGLISYKSIKSNFKGNYDQDEVLAKYARKTKHKLRVLGYDVIEALYYCTDDPNILNEKLYSIEDINPGDIVTARIIKKDDKIGGYSVKIGQVQGIIEQLYLARNVKYEVGLRLRCRVIDVSLDRKVCYLSNRTEYLSKNVRLLTSLEAAHPGNVFMGTVVNCTADSVLVKFSSGIKGMLYKQRLIGLLANEQNSFFNGQTMKFRIVSRNKEMIRLTLPEDKFQFGEVCPIEVTNSLESGLEIKITSGSGGNDDEEKGEEEVEDFMGLVPLRLLSDHLELVEAQKRVHPVGTQTKAACIMQNIFSLRDAKNCDENPIKDWHDIQIGDVMRTYVKNVNDQVVELLVPVRNYNKLVKLHVKMLRLNAVGSVPIDLTPEQVLYAKVLGKETVTKTLTMSAILTDVWNGQLSETGKMVERYLDEVACIKKALKKIKAPIAKHVIGEKIQVAFKGVDPNSNNWVYTTVGRGGAITALLPKHIAGNQLPPAVGTKTSAVILWIDYAGDLLLISNKKIDIDHITTSKKLPENLVGNVGMKAKVLLKLESIVICSLKKGSNPLVICPVRLHYNDIENTGSAGLLQGDFCSLACIHKELPIAVPANVWKLWANYKPPITEKEEQEIKPKLTPGKRKAEEEETTTTEILTNGKNTKELKKVKLDEKKNEKTAIVKAKQNGQVIFEDKTPNVKAVKAAAAAKLNGASKERLPGVAGFWETTTLNDLNGHHNQEASSSDEEDADDDAEQVDKKKRRLNAKERAKVEVQEEKRLREIEERNADPTQQPETIDQFERLILANPNSSKSWIEYVAFLLSNTEIEKARAAARRAIKTIGFRETGELLNVWSALLNLELIYNTSNFDEVLKEALTCNDPLEIYIRTVDILRKAQRKERLVDILAILLRKFKSEVKVWRIAADAYLSLGMADRVHQMLQRAHDVLPRKEHIECTVAFAKLYAKYDDNTKAQTLLDGVVTSFPNRVDVWVLYVDMLIKAQLIESARNVLERAVTQKLHPKKMVTIFKKYLDFEENHGTEANTAKVKRAAEQYVQNYNNGKV